MGNGRPSGALSISSLASALLRCPEQPLPLDSNVSSNLQIEPLVQPVFDRKTLQGVLPDCLFVTGPEKVVASPVPACLSAFKVVRVADAQDTGAIICRSRLSTPLDFQTRD